MGAIIDSSPLILFGSIDRLDLLTSLYEHIAIPAEVWTEVVVQGGERAHRILSALPKGIQQAPSPSDQELLARFPGLGPGERGVIVLGLQRRDSPVLILDDRRARRVAVALGLNVLGCLGVVVEAKRSGLLATVAPTFDALIRAGLFLDEAVLARALHMAGE